MNYSRQRELIYEALKRTITHPTAEMVHLSLKKEHPNLSLATVYRNLNQMCDVGMIRRLKVPDSPDRYDGNCDLHYHLACRCCKGVVDVHADEAFFECCSRLSLLLPHKVETCDVVFHGVCERCLKSVRS